MPPLLMQQQQRLARPPRSLASRVAVSPSSGSSVTARRRARPLVVAVTSATSPSSAQPLLTSCPVCGGTCREVCADCAGAGVLGRGGYVRRNPLPKQLVGSKWTAAGREPVLGWRHFVVEEKRVGGVGGGGEMVAAAAAAEAETPATTTTTTSAAPVFVRLRASCDPQARLWVSALLLRDRARWAAGWLRMDDVVLRVEGEEEEDAEQEETEEAPTDTKRRGRAKNSAGAGGRKIVVRGSTGGGAPCRKCAGTGWRPCSGCRGQGRAELISL